ncbi:GNAT family N-acetyltransferase [Synoicihabitans lomoniglobus]|uniref:GNAT family protein n=1 Tax=Synoicihabitans lomoniglobus TaxID=2909285 RepID=A0AAE9ZXL5_9BACT|nr:GNAT family N-acetyltransferase [Opitutaceae bacterium LMO-M01]WED64994.1 GNAT family protein [Opitutaceae bacterium LMO-M01]
MNSADTDPRPSFRVRPVTLANDHVQLEPMRPTHAPELFMIGQDEATWRYMPSPAFVAALDAANWVTAMLHDELAGSRVPLVVRRQCDDQVVGSTSLFDIRVPERAVEIGYTWYEPAACRTAVNTATKLLLLTHCFDTLGAERVQLKTDARNLASQRAIERLGATREGVLRHHMRVQNGFVRDSVYYSILANEWAPIRDRLTARLARG